jgi:hypothetical protein
MWIKRLLHAVGKRVYAELWINLGHCLLGGLLLHSTGGKPPTAMSPSTALILIF